MKIPFRKYHALGNDYLVLDPQKIQGNLALTPENIRLICHRNFGIGSDGILYGPVRDKGPWELNIFNPDGSEAEKSGNGIRIFSLYLKDEGYVTDTSFRLKTLGGEVAVEFLKGNLPKGKEGLIKVDMGKATFVSDQIPVTGAKRDVINETLEIDGKGYQVTCVSVGNPHCVIVLPQISEALARTIGPLVENHPQFPKRINMQLVQIQDRANIRIEIWERGAGYTLASGSSSCAAACAGHKLGLIDPDVTVTMPGGTIRINIQKDGDVHMTGPVTRVASGVIDPGLIS